MLIIVMAMVVIENNNSIWKRKRSSTVHGWKSKTRVMS